MTCRAVDGSCVRLWPEYRDHVWSYDFVHCRTELPVEGAIGSSSMGDGKVFRMLNILDEHSRDYVTKRVVLLEFDRIDECLSA